MCVCVSVFSLSDISVCYVVNGTPCLPGRNSQLKATCVKLGPFSVVCLQDPQKQSSMCECVSVWDGDLHLTNDV